MNFAFTMPTKASRRSAETFSALAHPRREAATSNWKAFGDDSEWQKVRDPSEVKGKLVDKVDSTFMALTDFSPAQ